MKQIISSTFNIAFTSAVHLLCCWLPLFAAISGQFSLGWLMAYKTPLILIQLGLLVWGFYDMYWRKTHSHTRLQKISLWAATILTIVLNLLPHRYFQSENSQIAANQFELVKNTRTVKFQLENKIPTQKLNDFLVTLNGIVPSQIAIEGTQLSVRYRTAQTNEQRILNSLNQNGFVVTLGSK